MSELITWQEALHAIADGKEVECRATGNNWVDAKNENHTFGIFISDQGFQFRFKPRTIMIGDVEVPAPFEPKEGDVIFVLANCLQCGYMSCKHETFEKHVYQFGVWRTEEEIKQVVAALHKLFKGE